MADVKDYPEILPFLDDTDDYENTATETHVNGNRLLIVTQKSATDGGQLRFELGSSGWRLTDADTFVDVIGSERVQALTEGRRTCTRSPAEDHEAVAAHMVDQVERFSSSSGPDGGNLACVWAVRRIVFDRLDRWITRTDGTSVFGEELLRCHGAGLPADRVAAGGIVISPTVSLPGGRRNIGHVGLLGPGGTEAGRKVYSNSSSRARWEQNFTLGSWISRYKDSKGLAVLFYPLPLYP